MSKSRSSNWPPMVTGEMYAASPCSRMAGTSPSSEPEPELVGAAADEEDVEVALPYGTGLLVTAEEVVESEEVADVEAAGETEELVLEVAYVTLMRSLAEDEEVEKGAGGSRLDEVTVGAAGWMLDEVEWGV